MISVVPELCDVCGTCVGVCPSDVITIERNRIVFDNDRCVMCDACVFICPVGAVKHGSENNDELTGYDVNKGKTNP